MKKAILLVNFNLELNFLQHYITCLRGWITSTAVYTLAFLFEHDEISFFIHSKKQDR